MPGEISIPQRSKEAQFYILPLCCQLLIVYNLEKGLIKNKMQSDSAVFLDNLCHTPRLSL
jgi:hypothetical protein